MACRALQNMLDLRLGPNFPLRPYKSVLLVLNMFCSDSISILNFIACAVTCRI